MSTLVDSGFSCDTSKKPKTQFPLASPQGGTIWLLCTCFMPNDASSRLKWQAARLKILVIYSGFSIEVQSPQEITEIYRRTKIPTKIGCSKCCLLPVFFWRLLCQLPGRNSCLLFRRNALHSISSSVSFVVSIRLPYDLSYSLMNLCSSCYHRASNGRRECKSRGI